MGRTPWHAGPQARFVRTPGQILSLTSHLSFSSQRSGATCSSSSGLQGSPSASFLHSTSSTVNPLNCSTNSGTRTTPILPRSPSHPTSLPLARLSSNSRPPLRRKNSFAESMAKCQKKADEMKSQQMSPKQKLLGSSPRRDPDSSFQLQQMPNSSMDLGAGSKNQTIEWKSESSPMKQGQSEREDKENMAPHVEGRDSPDLDLDLAFPDTQMLDHVTPPKKSHPEQVLPHDKTPPHRLFEGDDSLGSLSSSPKPLASSLPLLSSPPISPVHGGLAGSPSVKPATFLPTSPLGHLSSPSSSSPRSEGGLNKRIPSPRSSPSSTPTLSPSCLSAHSVAAANMRALRQRSGSTPETLRMNDQDSDLNLNITLDQVEETIEKLEDNKKNIMDLNLFEEDDDGDAVFTVPGSTPDQQRPEKKFKMPTPFPLFSKKRKVSSASCNSSTTGLTDDLTELAVLKRRKSVETGPSPFNLIDQWKSCEQREVLSSGSVSSSDDAQEPVQPSSRSKCLSRSSSEEEQGVGYGCSTPVLSPLSAVPLRMKVGGKGKAVQFKSPAGMLTPVQACKPPLHLQPGLTLAHLDAEADQMTTPPSRQRSFSGEPASAGFSTPFRLAQILLLCVSNTP